MPDQLMQRTRLGHEIGGWAADQQVPSQQVSTDFSNGKLCKHGCTVLHWAYDTFACKYVELLGLNRPSPALALQCHLALWSLIVSQAVSQSVGALTAARNLMHCCQKQSWSLHLFKQPEMRFETALVAALLLLVKIPLELRLWAVCKAAQHVIGIIMQLRLHVPTLAGNSNMMLPILHTHKMVHGVLLISLTL